MSSSGKRSSEGMDISHLDSLHDDSWPIEAHPRDSFNYPSPSVGPRYSVSNPPPQAIAKWAKMKGLPQFRDKKGRYISNDSRTFLLSRSIAKKGIRPFPFFTDALEQATQQLYNNLEDALVQDIENSIEI